LTDEERIARFEVLLQNERTLDELFCDTFQTPNFTLYYNRYFEGDPVFNHALISNDFFESDPNEDAIELFLEEIRAEAGNRNVPPILFENPSPNLQE
jgi:hypothetical protein